MFGSNGKIYALVYIYIYIHHLHVNARRGVNFRKKVTGYITYNKHFLSNNYNRESFAREYI